ncbi:uncharacterized protein [Pseudorasbora parva]|uniref:uncharacterized protein n=1 Tax=Pseudorasbora parva TaxID=51549 RepID=UPI00351F4B2C
MHPSPGLVCSDRPEGCVLPCVFLPQHRPFLRLAFEGKAYQYKVLPFGLSLSPRVFTKVAEAAIVPLRERGVRILNYLDGWLILAQSKDQLCEHRDLVLIHLSQLGLRVNREKSKTLSYTEDLLSRYGAGLGQPDGAPHRGASPVGVELLEYVQEQDGGPTEILSEAPGAYGICSRGHAARIASYETASTLARRPSPEVGVAERSVPGPSDSLLPPNLQPVVQHFVSPGRGAPRTSVQACCAIHGCLHHRLGGHVQRACSCWSVDGAAIALAYQLPRVTGSTSGTPPPQGAAAWQACTGPYGQHHGRCVHQPSGWSTLPLFAPTRPPPPPEESEAAEVASGHSCPWCAEPDSRRALSSADTSGRVATPPPGGPADMGPVRSRTGRPVCLSGLDPLPVVLFPDRGYPRHRCTGAQLAPGPTQVCVSPSEPSCTDSVQGQGGRGAGLVSCAVLAQPDLVPRTHTPRDSPSLADSPEEGPSFSGTGHTMAPASRPLESSCLVPGRDAEVLDGLPQAVVDTIASARAPSTRRLYALKWNLFVEWCASRREDPRRCSISVVLSFLQDGLERRLSPSTLKVYAAAIAAYHDDVAPQRTLSLKYEVGTLPQHYPIVILSGSCRNSSDCTPCLEP